MAGEVWPTDPGGATVFDNHLCHRHNAVRTTALNAAVAAAIPASGTPTGSVQFVDTSSKTVVGSATLSGGKAVEPVGLTIAAAVSGRPIAAVYSGDNNFTASTSVALPAVVNLASDGWGNFASDEIASVFGIGGLSGNLASTPPLNGVSVTLTDITGNSQQAIIYGVFGSAGQVNFLVPGGAPAGPTVANATVAGGGTITPC
jgi:Bacterial Ig-like domain (group 3)